MSEPYLHTNQAQKREFEEAARPTAILLDPNASEAAKDEARQRLDGLEGNTAPENEFGQVANEKPQDYDGEKAAKRVLEGSRHKTDLSD